MENTQFLVQNKGHGNETDSLSEQDSASQLKKLVEMENTHQPIIHSSQNRNGFLKGLFFLLVHGHNKIPNHIASAEDEIYVHHCLELAQISALKASPQYNNTPLRLQAKSIMLEESLNTLNSPLSQKFGASEENDMILYDFMDSPSDVHKGTTTTYFDCLNSASSVTLSKGMFQCTWKQGIPHFVFFADDEKEVYVAKLSKVVDTTNGEGLDYVYFFYKGIQKGHEEIFDTSDMQLLGKMNVSTTFTLCHDNSIMKETHFVLFGDNKCHHKENYTSKKKKNKGMCNKVSKMFKTSPSSSKFRVSSPTNLLGTNVPSNFELAAIVFKEHVPSHEMDKVGGWGLKFLKKCEVEKDTLPYQSYGRNTNNNEDCSTSMMSIVIPAGLHGGPRTGHYGPSSLVDRWRSGGCCDCGGWDEGCPLTILQRRASKGDDAMSQVDVHGQSLDLVVQDSRNVSPTMRMVNIHDGLYVVHFQPTLSALQSFSITVAIIHKQSPALCY